MTTTQILAVDPGVTTGYVLVKVSSKDVEIEDRIHFVDAGEWDSMDALRQLKYELFEETVVVVVERYVVYPNRAAQHIGDDLYTARVIGRVEWLAFTICGLEVVFQPASQAKQRWPQNRLAKHFPGARHLSNHIQDALRHLLTYIETNG